MIRWMVLIIMIQVYAVFCLPLIAEPGSRGTGRVSSISTFYPISPGIGEVQLKRAKTRFQLKHDFIKRRVWKINALPTPLFYCYLYTSNLL